MKIKILKNVVVGRRVAKAGDELDLARNQAGVLIQNGFAEEWTAPPPPPPPPSGKDVPPAGQ